MLLIPEHLLQEKKTTGIHAKVKSIMNFNMIAVHYGCRVFAKVLKSFFFFTFTFFSLKSEMEHSFPLSSHNTSLKICVNIKEFDYTFTSYIHCTVSPTNK